MSTKRRTFLGGAAAGAALLGLHSQDSSSTPASEPASSPAPTSEDPRVAELIELSRGRSGKVHIERAAFVSDDAVSGNLRIHADQAEDLRQVIRARDFVQFQQRGLHIGDHKFVFVRELEEGRVVHAVRPGEFITIRATPEQLVVASSNGDMAHPRAIEAVYQFVRRHAPPPRGVQVS